MTRMALEETTEKCNGIDLSCKKTLTHGEAKSQGDDDRDEDNIMLLTLVIQREQCSAARRSH